MLDDKRVLRALWVALTVFLVLLGVQLIIGYGLSERDWSAVGTVVQAVAAVIQAVLAYHLYQVSKKQAQISEFTLAETKETANAATQSVIVARNSLVLSQRPWLRVKIDTSRSNSIRWQNASMLGMFYFKVDNIGSSPAIRARIAYTLLPTHFGEAAKSGTHYWPHQHHQRWRQMFNFDYDPNYPSHTIFPQDSELMWNNGGIIGTQTQQVDDIWTYLRIIGADPSDRFSGFIMIGSVTYKFSGTDETYDTGFIFEIRARENIIAGRNIEANDMTVSDYILGRAPVT